MYQFIMFVLFRIGVVVPGSIVVRIPPCHGGGRGSIPRRGASLFDFFPDPPRIDAFYRALSQGIGHLYAGAFLAGKFHVETTPAA